MPYNVLNFKLKGFHKIPQFITLLSTLFEKISFLYTIKANERFFKRDFIAGILSDGGILRWTVSFLLQTVKRSIASFCALMSAEIGRKLGYTKLFSSLKSFSLRFFRLKKKNIFIKKNPLQLPWCIVLWGSFDFFS